MSELKPTDADRARAQVMVDEHFPNYARQTVGVVVRELVDALALALAEQRERDAQVIITHAEEMIKAGFWIKVNPVSFAQELAQVIREGR